MKQVTRRGLLFGTFVEVAFDHPSETLALDANERDDVADFVGDGGSSQKKRKRSARRFRGRRRLPRRFE